MAISWMIGTDFRGKGGVASVIRQYHDAGLLDDRRIRFQSTHNGRSALGKTLPFLAAIPRIWLGTLSGRVALIHAHTSFGGSFWRKFILTAPALLMGTPVLMHIHAGKFNEFYAQGSAWRKSCIRFAFRRAWRVIALSQEWSDWVRSVEPRSRVEVIPNSLPLQTGAQPSAAPAAEATVLFLGRVGKFKGTFDLLQSFREVLKQVGSARLVFGGDGDVDALYAFAEQLQIRHAVSHVGWVTGPSKDALLSQCWVFALPSYSEGLPVVLIEAMAYSKPVVSCPVGGIPQIVEDGKTGFLVAPGDIAALADRLIRCLTDRPMAQAMGAAGRSVFEQRFCNEVVFPRVLEIYRQAGA